MFSDFSDLLSHYGNFYLYGLLSTIILSLIGTFGGLFLGVFLAFGKRRDVKDVPLWKKFVSYPIRFISEAYSLIIRGTPRMVQARIFKYGCQARGLNWNKVLGGNSVFNGWFIAGRIVITFNTAAYRGEIVLSGLNGVDKGQEEGARSLGRNKRQTLFSVLLPQAIRNSIPTIGNEWVVNIKDSSVLNVIAVSELYWQANAAASKNYKYRASYLLIASRYLLLTLVATGILKFREFKLDGKKRKFNVKNRFFHFRKKEEANG